MSPVTRGKNQSSILTSEGLLTFLPPKPNLLRLPCPCLPSQGIKAFVVSVISLHLLEDIFVERIAGRHPVPGSCLFHTFLTKGQEFLFQEVALGLAFGTEFQNSVDAIEQQGEVGTLDETVGLRLTEPLGIARKPVALLDGNVLAFAIGHHQSVDNLGRVVDLIRCPTGTFGKGKDGNLGGIDRDAIVKEGVEG